MRRAWLRGVRLVVCPLAALAALAPGTAGAQLTPHGVEFQVNSYTTSWQVFPAVASDAAGNFVVAWTSFGSFGGDTSYTSIQAQRFAVDGTPLGAELQVNTYTPMMQMLPAVATDPAGNFVVAWSSFGSPGGDSDYSVQARRYAADGTPLGAQFQVNTYGAGAQCCADLTVAVDGDFVVVWSSAGSSGTDTDGGSIQAQRFAADGTRLGNELQVNGYTTGGQGLPDVAFDALGGFVVTWASSGSAGNDSDLGSIQARRFAGDGTPLGDDFQVNDQTLGNQDRPRVAAGPDGGFVVAWQSTTSAESDSDGLGVHARSFDVAGLPLGDQLQVNAFTLGDQERPGVAADGLDFVVTWQSAGSGGGDADGTSVQVRRFPWNGSAPTAELQANSHTPTAQMSPAVAIDARGDFVLAWQSDSSTGNDAGSPSIQARRFDGLFRDGYESGYCDRWSFELP